MGFVGGRKKKEEGYKYGRPCDMHMSCGIWLFIELEELRK